MTTTRSAKNKGVRLQNNIRDKIVDLFPEIVDDISTAIMGAGGSDIILTPKGKEIFPYSIEAKAHKVGFSKTHQALEQAQSQQDGLTPVAIVKQDRKKPIVIMEFDDFLKLTREVYGHQVVQKEKEV